MPSRRSVLAALSVGAASALAGCNFGSETPATETGSPAGDATPNRDATPTRTPTATLTPTGTPTETPTPSPSPPPTATPGSVRTAVEAITASDAASHDDFGTSLAATADAILVGAENADAPESEAAVGAAYAFERVDGEWTQTARLAPESGDPESRFGGAVALSEERAVIAASELSGPNDISSGVAHVYDRSGDDWARVGTLSTPEEDSDAFGGDVALSGDTAVVGAAYAKTGDDAVTGAAHVFERTDDGWERTETLAPDDDGDYDNFGRSVRLDGDTVLVGAPDAPDGSGQGTVYAFTRSDGTWTQRAKLRPPERDDEDYFGSDLALDDGRLLVAAPGEDDPNGYFGGAAHTFTGSGGEWTHEAKLLPDDGGESEAFGSAVALHGDRLLVGSEHDERPPGNATGSAYLFARADGGWTQAAKLLPPGDRSGDLLGGAAALTDAFGVVGAIYDDHPETRHAGSAFVFDV